MIVPKMIEKTVPSAIIGIVFLIGSHSSFMTGCSVRRDRPMSPLSRLTR